MTDADTIANAPLLWELVHLVHESIDKQGCAMLLPSDERFAEIRRLADECDPEGAW